MSKTLYLKYRPQRIEDIVGQDKIKKTIINAVKSDRLSHAYLFTGPRGTGKTTMSRILSCIVNAGDKPSLEYDASGGLCKTIMDGTCQDIHEIDAASQRSIDDVRAMKVNAAHAPMVCRKRVFIIDEVQGFNRLTSDSLLKLLEEPPNSVMFILATTEPQKILPTIKSRCQIFGFEKLKIAEIVSRLKAVCEAEGAKYDETALSIIARAATGSMRDSLSILDSVIGRCGDNITVEETCEIIGVADQVRLCKMMNFILKNDLTSIIKEIKKASNDGVGPESLFSSFLEYIHDMMISKNIGSYAHLHINESIKKNWLKQREVTDNKVFIQIINKLNQYSLSIDNNTRPDISIDACFVDIVSSMHC